MIDKRKEAYEAGALEALTYVRKGLEGMIESARKDLAGASHMTWRAELEAELRAYNTVLRGLKSTATIMGVNDGDRGTESQT